MTVSRRVRRVLSVASECAPLVKTGGLADVVGALPRALHEVGWRSRVLLPAYPGILEQIGRSRRLWRDENLFGGPASVRSGRFGDLDLLLLDAPHLFDREGGPYGSGGYDHHDNHVRFAALSWVASRLAIEGTSDRWRPDIVHAHDWQAGLTPSYMKYAGATIPSVMTVHNIAFQGVVGADQLDLLRLPVWDFHPDALEYHGLLSTLKAGMVHASHVTTVSPTYAQELTTPEFGFGLEGVVRARSDRGELTGILNGIDTLIWDPATDPHTVPYTAENPEGKATNRRVILDEFGLTEPVGPLAVVITRLTYQKGIDLMLEALPGFIESGGAVVVLGSGDPGYEHGFRELQSRYPQSLGLHVGYDEALSHRMYAAGDIVLVPSRFEPCGLTQMYGLRYGAVPVVSAVGGLADTVTDATPENFAAGTATGFTFTDLHAGALAHALDRASTLFSNAQVWRELRRRAMSSDVDWRPSAETYARVFESLLP